MRQLRVVLFLIICLSMMGIVFAGEGVDETSPETEHDHYQTYTVKSNDTLFLIAEHFNTTPRILANLNNITNPNVIIAGQVLKVPNLPLTTPPADTARYTVQSGETLAIIAKKFDTTVSLLRSLNEIANANLVFAGQIINVPLNNIAPTPTLEPSQTPSEQIPAPEETIESEFNHFPTTTPTLTPTPEPEVSQPETSNFYSGIEIYYQDQDIEYLITHINQLDLDWVRVKVDWRYIEPEQGIYQFADLDALITTLHENNRHILLTIANAPAWARSNSAENGPPDDLLFFEQIIQTLLTRYDSQINAYQIWDEPNLRRNWNCDGRMCERSYLELVQLASQLIRNHDPSIKIISAGLAPTRFNDSINAIDDRIFLDNQITNGLGLFVDGIGIHPGGEANPPDTVCCNPVNNIESHYENEVFYFLENLEGYRTILNQQNLVDMPLWVTKFGWGTGEDVTSPSNPNQPHYSIRYTSLNQQAIYIPRALELGRELGYIEAMFINNLNGCAITQAGGLPELCFPSLIGPDGSPRPVYDTVQNLD